MFLYFVVECAYSNGHNNFSVHYMKKDRWEGGVSPQFEEQQAIDKAALKAEEILKETAIDPEQFADVYRVDQVREDGRMQPRDAESPLYKYKQILLGMLQDRAEDDDLWGPRSYVRTASAFDSSRNHIDQIVEFVDPLSDEDIKGGGKDFSYLALGVEVANTADFTKKFEALREKIESGDLSEVKYYDSEESGVHGPKRELPHVVIGAAKETVHEVGSLWLDNPKALGHHHIQHQILVEAELQLETFIAHAKRVGNVKVATVLEKALGKVQATLQDKGDIPRKDIEKDFIFRRLREDLHRVFADVSSTGREEAA